MEKIAKFNWEDPFLLNEQLSEEERMVYESAQAFAQEKLLPRVSDAFVNETVAPEIFAEMRLSRLSRTYYDGKTCHWRRRQDRFSREHRFPCSG